MPVCPNCSESTFPDDLYCGNCRTLLPRISVPKQSVHRSTDGLIKCRKCGHMNESDSLFCELDGAQLSRVSSSRNLKTSNPRGVLIMPDQSEVTLSRDSRVFGRRDLIKFLKPESSREISRAHFTIIHEGGTFYLREGARDRKNPHGWRSSANKISVNGVVLESGTKQKLNPADLIDIEQLGLNLTFKII